MGCASQRGARLVHAAPARQRPPTSVRMAAQLYMIIVSPLTGQILKIFFPEISDLDVLALRVWFTWVMWRVKFPSRRRP